MSGFDHIFHAGSLAAQVRSAHELNSWGVDDEMMYDEAIRWAAGSSASRQPFFLQLLTLATHHPYSVPSQFGETKGASDPTTRYQAALYYTPHIAFFQTRGWPARLGLRDGRWKFISGLGADREVHLFDLASDPFKQRDQAARVPEQAETYGRLCAAWYARATKSYAAQTEDGEAGVAELQPRDLSVPGPTAITLRVVDGTRPQQEFQRDAAIVATTEWIPYGEAKLIRYQWSAPNGEARSVLVPLRPGERVTTDMLDHRPLAPRFLGPDAFRWRDSTRRDSLRGSRIALGGTCSSPAPSESLV